MKPSKCTEKFFERKLERATLASAATDAYFGSYDGRTGENILSMKELSMLKAPDGLIVLNGLSVMSEAVGITMAERRANARRKKGQMKTGSEEVSAASPNNRKKDASHLYISWSLYPDSSQAEELRAFIVPNRDNFFPVDVIRTRRQ